MEKKLRTCILAHIDSLLESTVDLLDTRRSFVAQALDRISALDGASFDQSLLRKEKNEDDFIKIVSIDVPMRDIHGILYDEKDSKAFEFLQMALDGKNYDDCFLEGVFVGKDFVSKTHVTMAHFEGTDQATMRIMFGPLIGHKVVLTVKNILWSDRVAAMGIELSRQSIKGSPLPESQNSFPHITLWFRKDTSAVEANNLPVLVDSGEAKRVDFEDSFKLTGTVSFWGKDNEPFRTSTNGATIA